MPSKNETMAQGVLVKIDIGPGLWRLKLPDDSTIDLYGEIPTNLVGRCVTVRGQSVGAGIGAGKRAMKIHSITAQ